MQRLFGEVQGSRPLRVGGVGVCILLQQPAALLTSTMASKDG